MARLKRDSPSKCLILRRHCTSARGATVFCTPERDVVRQRAIFPYAPIRCDRAGSGGEGTEGRSKSYWHVLRNACGHFESSGLLPFNTNFTAQHRCSAGHMLQHKSASAGLKIAFRTRKPVQLPQRQVLLNSAPAHFSDRGVLEPRKPRLAARQPQMPDLGRDLLKTKMRKGALQLRIGSARRDQTGKLPDFGLRPDMARLDDTQGCGAMLERRQAPMRKTPPHEAIVGIGLPHDRIFRPTPATTTCRRRGSPSPARTRSG